MHRQPPTHTYKQEIPYEEIQKTIDTNEDENYGVVLVSEMKSMRQKICFFLINYLLFASVIDNLKNYIYLKAVTRPDWFNADP